MTAVKIREIGVKANSQDGDCWARRENVWTATFPIQRLVGIGVGFLVEPQPYRPSWTVGRDFVLHDHAYSRDHVPVAERATIDFFFSGNTRVAELLVVQHANGITEIEGSMGTRGGGSPRRFGKATSGLVGNAEGYGIFNDGAPDLFVFDHESTPGNWLQLVITRTSARDGWANYRIYPRGADHDPYTVSSIDTLRIVSDFRAVASVDQVDMG